VTPFEPAGDKARWRVLYDVLTKHGVGDVVTYDVMGEALNLDPEKERHTIQMAIRRAAREYEREDHRALEPVPNEGYRVVEPAEHMRLARRPRRPVRVGR
jgi:hypothetical protein